jgi:1,4-dihydroxy-2-naphthoyl-CoA hydrolase
MTVVTQPDIQRLIPLAGLLGIEVDSATKDEVVGRIAWREDLCTSATVLHGGALMAFADTLGAVCASLNLPEGAMTTTIESKTNFFRAVTEGEVKGTATPLHVGRRTIVVQTKITRPDGKSVALVTQTQAVLTND